MEQLDRPTTQTPDSGLVATLLGTPDSGTEPTAPKPDLPDYAAIKEFLLAYGTQDGRPTVRTSPTMTHTIGADLVNKGFLTPADLGVPHLEDSIDIRRATGTVRSRIAACVEKLFDAIKL